MRRTALAVLIAATAIVVCMAAGHALAETAPHWAKGFVDKMVSEKIMPTMDVALWDKDVAPDVIKSSLDAALGKDTGIDVGKPLNRAMILKAAVDVSSYAGDMEQFKGDPWCMSNDELTIPADFIAYFNMAYRPKYDLLTYKKGRMTGWDKPMTYAELAYMSYKFKHSPNTKPNQQLTMVTTGEPDTINPYTTSAAISRYINQFASWGGDVTFGDDATLYPFQLTRVPSVDNGDIKVFIDPATGRSKETVTYHIRKGLYNPPIVEGEKEKLHEITSDDYLFTMRVSIVPRIQAISRTGLWKVDSIKKIDKYTIEVIWNEIYTYANGGWGDTYKAAFEQDLYTAPQDFNTREDFINYSNGPYKMVKWDKGDHIEFTSNPYAIYSKPLLDKVIIRFMTDQNTVNMNLLARSVDCAGITPLDYKDLKEKLPDYKFVLTEATSWSHIDLNLFKEDPKNPKTPALNWVFGDKRVRQAMLYAIDRDEIKKVVFQDIYKVADSWMPPKSKYYNPDAIKKYPFDPKKAEQLLDQAGWKMVKIGNEMVRCKNGDPKQPFDFKFRINSEQPTTLQMAELVKKMLGRIGLKITPVPVVGKELLGQSLVRHEWEMITFAWISYPIRPSADLFLKKQIPTSDNNWAGQNFVGWDGGAEHDKICEEMSQELPDAKLQDLFDRELKIWTEELPILPMFNTYSINVCPLDLQNYKPTGSTAPTSWNSAWWYREVF